LAAISEQMVKNNEPYVIGGRSAKKEAAQAASAR
jgi:hypothetical protein